MKLDLMLDQLLSKNKKQEKIEFSKRLYVRISDYELALVSLAFDNVQIFGISLEEAKKIFRSIKCACDLHTIEKTEVSELRWMTDARSGSKWWWINRVVVGFDTPLGSVREYVRKRDLTAAVNVFVERFGLVSFS